MDVFFAALKDAFAATSVTEWLIFATAMAYVILAARESVLCWLFGIISSGLSVYLCYQGKLFLESGLSLFYVLMGFYGWHQWLHGSSEKKTLHVISWTGTKILLPLLAGVLLWLPFGFIAKNYSTQALPWLDAFITAFSLVATWMTTRKILENWLFWVIIDGLAILLYASRGFHLIALLYVLYTIIAFAGYLKWRKTINQY